jgi:hypothetical protein
MKKHITQSAIDTLAQDYNSAHRSMRINNLNGNQAGADIEYNVMIAYANAFGILTGQDYDTARMMLRKRAGIV